MKFIRYTVEENNKVCAQCDNPLSTGDIASLDYDSEDYVARHYEPAKPINMPREAVVAYQEGLNRYHGEPVRPTIARNTGNAAVTPRNTGGALSMRGLQALISETGIDTNVNVTMNPPESPKHIARGKILYCRDCGVEKTINLIHELQKFIDTVS
jgi:hypothetical protein